MSGLGVWKMFREELIQLGYRLIAGEDTEEEQDALYHLFNANVPYPNAANLFYWPENYNFQRDNIAEYNPTVEEIVDKALAYKPVIV